MNGASVSVTEALGLASLSSCNSRARSREIIVAMGTTYSTARKAMSNPFNTHSFSCAHVSLQAMDSPSSAYAHRRPAKGDLTGIERSGSRGRSGESGLPRGFSTQPIGQTQGDLLQNFDQHIVVERAMKLRLFRDRPSCAFVQSDRGSVSMHR
jgi:hypothetical protein